MQGKWNAREKKRPTTKSEREGAPVRILLRIKVLMSVEEAKCEGKTRYRPIGDVPESLPLLRDLARESPRVTFSFVKFVPITPSMFCLCDIATRPLYSRALRGITHSGSKEAPSAPRRTRERRKKFHFSHEELPYR